MKGDRIKYKEGYRYQLVEDYAVQTPIRPPRFVLASFLRLDTDGMLYIRAGYAWDGPSGPAIDTPDFMRGSLVHDALYQLMREGHIDPDQWRLPTDKVLREIVLEDGMWKIRAWWVYQGVRFGAGPSSEAAGERPVLSAPP